MKSIFTLILVSCIFINSYSQSDDCATATTITSNTICSSPVIGTTAGATQSMPGCVGNADDDVWYKFVASYPSANLTVSPSIGFDAVVEVFDGTCGILNSLNCVDQSGNGGSETVNLSSLNIGATYYFRVYDYYTAVASPTFSVCLISSPPPVNDDCSSATTVVSTTSCTPIIASSFGATQSLVGCAGNADDDIWYQFVATGTSHSVSVTSSPTMDAVLEVFSGTCGSLNSLYCLDNSGAGTPESIHMGGLTIGNTYYFRVYSYYSTSSAVDNFTICLMDVPAQPSNDECTGATSIPVTANCNVTTTILNSFGATESISGCVGSADDDIWCKFVATTPDETINVTTGVGVDAVIQLFNGSCGSLVPLSCTDNSGTNQTETAYVSNLTVGQTYYFRIYDYYATGGQTFSVSVVTRELMASASASTICLGGTVTLNASGTPTYTWSNGVSNGVAFSPTTTNVYTVTGIGTGGCTNTATVAVNVSVLQTPDICMVTVDTLNMNNIIYWDKYSYNNLDSMIIYREVVANTYQRIGVVDRNAFSRFVDTTRHVGFRNGDPNVRSYRYKLQIRDTCGNYSALSPYHTSLFLNSSAGLFTWNFYDIESQSSSVNNYEIYRDDNNTGAFNLIGTVTATLGIPSYTFTDVNYSTFAATAKWGIVADGFSCYPSYRGNGAMSPAQQIIKSKSNVKNNFTIPSPPNDPDPQGVREIDLESYIRVFPNPANDYLTIESAFVINKIQIYNSLGALVYNANTSNSARTNINVQDLSNGIYSIEIMTQNGRIVKKLVVQK